MSGFVDFRLRPPIAAYRERDVMYTDAARTSELSKLCGMSPTKVLRTRSLADTVAEMDAAGIAVAVVPARRGTPAHGGDVSNDEVAALVSESGGRFVGSAALDLRDPVAAAREADRALDRHEFRCLMIEPGLAATPVLPDDRTLYPIYEVARAHARPISISLGGNAVPDVRFSDPVSIDHVARDFPELAIVVAHGAWPWVSQILHVAHRRRNVYIEPGHYVFGFAGWRDYVDAGNTYLSDRLVFATTFPYLPLVDAVRRYEQLFTGDAAARVLGANARALLGLGSPVS
jgi:predicted TIM-barrel fold metal-dependent hydrolase